MGCIPVSSIKDAYCIVVLRWQTFEEFDETSFIVNLEEVREWRLSSIIGFTLSSGREDIFRDAEMKSVETQ
jgi:hypothetical protein